MRRIVFSGGVLFLFLASAPASAQDPPTISIPRVDTPPVLEQFLVGGPQGPAGLRVDGFRQREPGDGVPVSQDTVAYLSFDQQHLYVAFVCADQPGKVRANMTRREAIEDDDGVAVLLDTYHDGRRAYMFRANAFGIQLDGISSEGQDHDDISYDTLWRSEGRLTAGGYVVLFAIPFRSLRFPGQAVQTWGIALGRAITRNNETAFWPYVTRRISGFGQQLATLEGIEGVSPGRNLQAIPYGSFATARLLGEDGVRESENTGRIGLDAKAVIRDAMTVDFTANPDFSQVESDEPQVTVNQRFEVFFPEKRPFFIENASYFETPENLFHSRRVADPGVGGRLTGKGHGWSFGSLVANDDQPGRSVDASDPRHGKTAAVVVMRAQREFARQSYLGGIFTDREIGPASNRVYGVDGRWKIDDNWVVTSQWIGSSTRRADGESATGSSFLAEVERDGRGFRYSGNYLSRSPDFRAELGFVPRVDMRETEQDVSYNWHPEGGPVLRVSPGIEGSVLWDYGGRLEEWTVEPGFEIELPGDSEIGLRNWNTYERYEDQVFRHSTYGLFLRTAWFSWLSANSSLRWGSGINYYPPEGLAPFLADEREIEFGVTLRPLSRLRLDETYIHSSLSTREGVALPPGAAAGRIFRNHIFRSRADYQFTRELSGRVILDYETVSPNPALVSLEHERRFNVDVLFTYLVNPWTAFYVGYTDNMENRLLPGPMQRPSGAGDAPLTSVGRQLFAKVSYLFRY